MRDCRIEVSTYLIAGTSFLHLPMPYDIQVGDTFTVVPGCRKRRTEDCIVKFNNIVNFRGFRGCPVERHRDRQRHGIEQLMNIVN
jgi:hypothetical protein